MSAITANLVRFSQPSGSLSGNPFGSTTLAAVVPASSASASFLHFAPRITLTTCDGTTNFLTIDEAMQVANIRNPMCNDLRPVHADFRLLGAPELDSRGRLRVPFFMMPTMILQPRIEEDTDDEEEDFEEIIHKDFSAGEPTSSNARGRSYIRKDLSFLFSAAEATTDRHSTPSTTDDGLALRRVPSRVASATVAECIEEGLEAIVEAVESQAMEKLSLQYRGPSVLRRPFRSAPPRELYTIVEADERDEEQEEEEAPTPTLRQLRQLRRDSLPTSTFERYLARARTSSILSDDSDDSDSDSIQSTTTAATNSTSATSDLGSSLNEDRIPLGFRSGRRDSDSSTVSSSSVATSIFSRRGSTDSYYFDDEYDTDSEDELDDADVRHTFRTYLAIEAGRFTWGKESQWSSFESDHFCCDDDEDEWETIVIGRGRPTTHLTTSVSASSFPAPPSRPSPRAQSLSAIDAASLGLPVFTVPADAALPRCLASLHPDLALPSKGTNACPPTPPTSPTRSTF